MKTVRLFLLIGFAVIVAADTASSQTPAPDPVVRSLEAARTLMRELKGALARQMAKGGARAAVNVCADSAQVLTRSLGTSLNLSIQRVSTRWRNPLNAPDSLDATALASFEKMRSAGTLTDTSIVVYRTTSDSGLTYHTYVPIVAQTFCLSCHGARHALAGGVDSLLTLRYPEDRASGHSAGDLRGAVRVRILDR